jgi:uncharacterized protein (DUF302 family)
VKQLAWIALAVGLLTGFPAGAEEIIMVRVPRTFPEAINALQDGIRARGYTVSRVQRVDVGLTSSGFKTAEYRLVFFGKEEEIRTLPARAPELIPYLPLTIVVYAEGDETLALMTNPAKLAEFVGYPELHRLFRRWEQDVRAIFRELAALPD